jgi:hypothetical protein
MNVLLIDHATEVGGGQVVFASLVRAFLHFDRPFKVSCIFPRGRLKSYLLSDEALKKERLDIKETRYAPISLLIFISNLELLLYLTMFAREAICILNGLRYLPALALYSHFKKSVITVYIHSNQSKLRWKFYRIFLKIAFYVKLVFVSEYSKNLVPAFVKDGLDNVEFYVLENCVERVNNKLSSKVPVVGFCGAKSFEKGYDVFLSLAKQNPSLKFVAVGPDGDVNDLNLDNLISYSFSPFPRQLLSSEGVSVLIVPTRLPETFCMVAAEGFLDGRCVIARRIGYMASPECDYIDFLVCNDEFDGALKSAVNRINKNDFLRSQVNSDRFSFTRFSEGLFKIVYS